MGKLSKAKILQEVEDFKKDTGKNKFTGIEFVDYLESKGIELDRSDYSKVIHTLSTRFHKRRITLIEYDERDIVYMREVNQYEV